MGQTRVELYHGDCLEVMPTLAAGSVDMVFADLPYGTKKGRVTANTWDTGFDLITLWQRLTVIGACRCAFVFTAKQPFCVDLLNSNRKQFRYDCIYIKSRPTRHHHAHRMPLNGHEHLLIFGSGKLTYNPIKTPRITPKIRASGTESKNYNSEPNRESYDGRIYTDRFPTSVISVKSESFAKHPTQKPVALLEWLIKTYTNPGDTVLDPVAGSGTTAIAALRTGRHSICIEKDPVYFAVMQKRVADERVKLGLEAI